MSEDEFRKYLERAHLEGSLAALDALANVIADLRARAVAAVSEGHGDATSARGADL